jgi:hypothetical protein
MKSISLKDKPHDYADDNGHGQPTHIFLKSEGRWIPTPKGYTKRPEGWKSHIYWNHKEDGWCWIETPTLEELDDWQSDCICENPEGERVEPDHSRSWMSVLGLI